MQICDLTAIKKVNDLRVSRDSWAKYFFIDVILSIAVVVT